MSGLAWAGIGLAGIGLVLILVCILRAVQLRRGDRDPEAAAAGLKRVILVNTVAVALAFLGLAMLLAGLLLF